MSTNFYLMPDGETDTDNGLHVLKRSRGYTIQALRDTPLGTIESWDDWRRILRDLQPGWRLVDEYGTSVDPADLIAEVDAVPATDRARHVRHHEDSCVFVGSSLGLGPVRRVRGPQTAWENADRTLSNHWHDAEGHLVIGAVFF